MLREKELNVNTFFVLNILVVIGNQIQKRSIGTYGLPDLVGDREGKCHGRCNSGLSRAAQSHSRDAPRVVEEVRSG